MMPECIGFSASGLGGSGGLNLAGTGQRMRSSPGRWKRGKWNGRGASGGPGDYLKKLKKMAYN